MALIMDRLSRYGKCFFVPSVSFVYNIASRSSYPAMMVDKRSGCTDTHLNNPISSFFERSGPVSNGLINHSGNAGHVDAEER